MWPQPERFHRLPSALTSTRVPFLDLTENLHVEKKDGEERGPAWGLPRGQFHAGNWSGFGAWSPHLFTGPAPALTLSQERHVGAESDL